MITQADVERECMALGRDIAAALPDGMGFTLMIYSFGEDGFLSYLSNSQRRDVIRAMEEFIDRHKD